MKDLRPHRLFSLSFYLLSATSSVVVAEVSPLLSQQKETKAWAKDTQGTAASAVCTFPRDELVRDACASYAELERINREIRPTIRGITQELDYFGYYRLNLYGKECPFWSNDNGMCGNIACAVMTIDDEEHIPPIWRSDELGKLAGPKATHPKKVRTEEPSPLGGQLGEDKGESCIVETDECDERDYCIPEDERSQRGDYVSLKDNPERFTGYAGMGANNVWEAIYRENCFPRTGAEPPPPKDDVSRLPFSPFGFAPKQQVIAANDLKAVLTDTTKKNELVPAKGGVKLHDLSNDEECLEKRVFYRVISGMHASISMHLCWDYLNQSTGQWGPNLDCYISRFGQFPERLQNIYFNYALVLRAVSKLQHYLDTYTFCTSDASQNRFTKARTLALAKQAAKNPPVFDESLMFADAAGRGLKDDFRNRFRNVSRIMDCVGCDKCRLWGKVQTQGYGTALKVLFEFDEGKGMEENPPLRRTELVALVNTFDRISTSIYAAGEFRRMVAEREAAERKAANKSDDGTEKPQKKVQEDESLWQVFLDECWLVYQAYIQVLIGWYRLPGAIWFIIKTELARFWNDFLGLRVPPRQYVFDKLKWEPPARPGKVPVKEEL